MLCGVVNWSLEQHLPSRGRALSIHTLGVIRVGGGVILQKQKAYHLSTISISAIVLLVTMILTGC